jgi:copper(I)-binding protein
MLGMRRISVLATAALALLGGCDRHPAGTLWVDQAWVRLAAAPGQPSAGYLVVHGGSAATRLLAVESASAGSSELHRSMSTRQGAMTMTTMQPVDGIDVPANATVALAPGSYHLMLFGVAPQVVAGGTMPLTVRFAKGDPVLVKAKVVALGDPSPY